MILKKSTYWCTPTLKSVAFFATLIIFTTACSNDKDKQDKQHVVEKIGQDNNATIVYVNSDTLLTHYEYFKVIKRNFEEKGKKAQADLQARGMAFQREVAEYQRTAGSMSAEQRSVTEQRLSKKQQELSAYNQNASNALAKEEQLENEKLYNKVADFLKKYAKDKGYKMVLSYAKGNSALLYADESLDVTKEVIGELNESYKNEN